MNFLMASPLARGLARAAIAHSHTSFGRMTTLAEAEQNGVAFMKAAGKKSLAELRAMSSEEMFKVFQANRGPQRRGRGRLVPADGHLHDLRPGQTERCRAHHGRHER